MKRAFTLIELLVVIAIIAILAAILFPVFAQAKEAAKKTAHISNMKQTGTSFAIYEADSDDQFPIGIAHYSTGPQYRVGDVPVPNGWRISGLSASEPTVSEQGAYWANSIQPYAKSYAILEAPGLPEYRFASIAGDYANPKKKWANSNVLMNGLLHTLSTSEVAQPSRLPMLWGYGKINIAGQALANPELYCPDGNLGCRWSADGNTQGNTGPQDFAYWEFFGGWSQWTYGKGAIYVATDTSAKFRTMAGPPAPGQSVVDQPYNSLNAAGAVAGAMNHCKQPSGYYWPCLFRPDNPFDGHTEAQLF